MSRGCPVLHDAYSSMYVLVSMCKRVCIQLMVVDNQSSYLLICSPDPGRRVPDDQVDAQGRPRHPRDGFACHRVRRCIRRLGQTNAERCREEGAAEAGRLRHRKIQAYRAPSTHCFHIFNPIMVTPCHHALYNAI